MIQEQDLSEEKACYENQSRNTYENVLYMKPLIEKYGVKDEPGQLKHWLLITSASHMYRSVKIFQKQGLSLLPVPVDYQTANSLQWTEFDLVDGAQNWHDVIHEAVALFAYWITGKI
ncbi:YdcF family protein [Polynucleobacter necessarius]|uniref:YdcF family protein n=1 Tax=Polynucleobacter necessarius TaxID=576610 RepID=UPI0018D4E3F3|nr:YdcF family protein [Polynucleobacter necessarius]